jgi:Ca2+-binding RTX toxin-like protein
LTGSTGEAGDKISLYDGSSWIAATSTDSSGNFSFTLSAAAGAVHSYGFNDLNLAGRTIHSTDKAILGATTGTATLTGTSGNDIINANGGSDTIVGGAGADVLTGGSGNVTFSYKAVADSTPTAHGTITDFRHGVDKIDFTNISGITANNGIPQFQGNITGIGNLTLNAHSVAYLETGGNTEVLVNTTSTAEVVTTSNASAANMEVVLLGVNLGLASTDFHHA